MARATVYYDYHEGEQVPVWFVLYFGAGKIKWEEDYLYVPVYAPFEKQAAQDFHDDTLSFSISIGDLTKRSEMPEHVGVYLPNVKKKIKELGGDPLDVEQFIFLVADIEEVMQMDVKQDLFNI
ncbi:hypothetical protein ACJ2A9_21535 [Anaerobacillus sp. MEB173]|uniref:hypothetical protein n=1 Tax=Anaerobacillus sp. MEB173 TaxID=3383345 RepID=UPI003F91AEB1